MVAVVVARWSGSSAGSQRRGVCSAPVGGPVPRLQGQSKRGAGGSLGHDAPGIDDAYPREFYGCTIKQMP
jgi:hypothetical protein